MTKAPRRKNSPLSSTPFTKKEDKAIWEFLWQKIQNKRNGGIKKLDILQNRRLWNDFEFAGGHKRSHQEYQNRMMDALAPSLHENSLSFQKKIDLYYGLSLPVEAGFQNTLKRSGKLKLDGVGCIVSFEVFEKDEPGSKKKETEPETSVPKNNLLEVKPTITATKPFSADEEKYMWMFLLDKVRDQTTGEPVKRGVSVDLNVWKSYKPPSANGRSPQEYSMRYSQEMCHTLHEAKLLKQFKLNLYFGLDLQVNEAFLLELRKSADVEVDEQGRIEKYKDRHEGGIVLGYQENEKPSRKIKIITSKDALDTDSFEYAPERSRVKYEWDSKTDSDFIPSDDDTIEEGDTMDISESWREPECQQEKQKKTSLPYQKIRQMKRRIDSHYDETFYSAEEHLQKLRDALACFSSPDFNDLKQEVDRMIESGDAAGKLIPTSSVDHLAHYAVKIIEDASK